MNFDYNFDHIAQLPLFGAAIALMVALILLVMLAVIDLRSWLLPDRLVFPLAVLGPAFHLMTGFDFLLMGPMDMLAGGAAGFLMLFSIRGIASYLLKRDALGLGDVKLMGAAGLWLGYEGLLLSLTLGGAAGVIHGAGIVLAQKIRTGRKPDLNRLMIPAGPGFITGIVLSGMWMFHEFRLL